MIVKSNRRRTGARSFGAIYDYLNDPRKVGWSLHSTNVHGSNSAAAEMCGVAVHAPHCHKPALHLSLAWSPHDSPSRAGLEQVVHRVLRDTGLAEHQWAAFAHQDTAHAHVHVLVNLVHPTSYTVRPIAKVFATLMPLARALEREFGWHAPHQMELDEVSPSTVRGLGQKPTFGRWARTAVAPAAEQYLARPEATWQGLHTLFASLGVRYVPTMRGGKIEDPWNQHFRVRASRVHVALGRARLEAKLGPFEPALDDLTLSRQAGYSATIVDGPKPDRGPDELRDRFVAACAQAGEQRRTPEEAAIDRAAVRARRMLLERQLNRDLKRVQELPAWYRLIVVAALLLGNVRETQVFELAAVRQRRAQRVRRERLQWRRWLLDQARAGDDQARAYLRRHGVVVANLDLAPPLPKEKRLSVRL